MRNHFWVWAAVMATITGSALAQNPPIRETRPNGPATRPAAAAATSQPAASQASPETVAAFRSHGFFVEMGASVFGAGPDNPARLPKQQLELWDNAVRLDKLGKRAETLEALRALDDSIHGIPNAALRLEGVSRREREGEGFSQWMARIHWELLEPTYKKNGTFDLKDVRDIEKPGLLALMRDKTGPALEPLKGYFPPADPKTGLPAYQTFQQQQQQLQGITADNALDVKDKALYASALLKGQMKLDATITAADKRMMLADIGTIARIMGRAQQFEPQARALLAKQEAERKAAEDRAKREAAASTNSGRPRAVR